MTEAKTRIKTGIVLTEQVFEEAERGLCIDDMNVEQKAQGKQLDPQRIKIVTQVLIDIKESIEPLIEAGVVLEKAANGITFAPYKWTVWPLF